MDEAKTLVNMSLSAVFASMFLAAAVGLIAVGHMLWGSLSRQDAANKRLADYANYTAFDNTTVRGQEIISLIESEPDIFIVIYDSTEVQANKTMDDQELKAGILAKYVPNNGVVEDFVPGTLNFTENSVATCERALVKFKSHGNDTKVINLSGKDLTSATHEELISHFTNGANNSGDSTDDSLATLGYPCSANDEDPYRYAAFKSVLVYDSDNTTDIIGILFVRQSIYVDTF